MNMERLLRYRLLLGAACLASWAASAQTPETPASPTPGERKTIGLALSGGGARGGAHIGVLKALEELRVPIDYIAGTSIGAVVGGFYAAGLSVEELEEVVDNTDWEAAFLNATPRQLRSFRRKRDDDLFLVSQKPGLNDGEFELPIGVVQGHIFDLIISRVTLPVSGVDDFDNLQIPFRAVAADIATGEPVVLGSGGLARAIRASMSLPAALTPVEIDGRLLVDGGVATNLPVEIAQDMGADVVIAVDISSALLNRESLRSVLDVTTQLTNLLTRRGVAAQRELLGPDDVLLTPQFSDALTSMSFARISETIEIGYDVVMEQREELERFALDPASYDAYLASRRNPRVEALPILNFVRLDNDSIVADSVIRTRLRDIEIGEPLDIDVVERAMNKVYGLELYQNVRYNVVTENGETGLEIDLDTRTWGPNYLQLGVEYSSSGDEDTLFALAASYLRTTINELNGEWRATFVVGDEPALLADLYQPLGDSGLFFFAPALTFESRLFNVFDDEDLAAELKIREATLEVAAGRELEGWGEVRFGVRSTVGDNELRVGDPAFLPDPDFRRGEFFTKLSADTMDSVAFPRSGTLATAEWRGSREHPLSADVDFDQLLLSAAHAKTWGRHTMLSTFRYDATVSGEAPVSRLFRLGGFFDLSGLNQNQLSGQHAARIGASYYRRIGDLALFPAFAGISLELGNVWQSRSDMSFGDSILGGSFWAGVNTPVGPVYVGYGRAEGGADGFYVFLGRIF